MSGSPSWSSFGVSDADVAQHDRGKAALVEHRGTEAADAGLGDREIDLELVLEVLELLGAHEAVGDVAHRLGIQDVLVDRVDLAPRS